MLRDLYAADFVHMLTGTGNMGGVATSATVGDESDGFAITVASLSLVFAHELGHNMGLKHDRYQTLKSESGIASILAKLWLSGNQLMGAIPSELGNLSSLTELGLSGNQLSGMIPPELGNLSNLRYLFLGDNSLIGCIPAGLRDLEKLADHDLDQLGLEFCEESLLSRYDADGDGRIIRDEVITAIRDYLVNDAISREDAIEIIRLYLFG